MFKLITKLPKQLTIAFSGGVDSVAAVDFLSKKHIVKCAFFNHGTSHCDSAEVFVKKFCNQHNLELVIGHINNVESDRKSLEEHWRDERYSFLESIDGTVITAHNLDDCVETYLFSALTGTPKVIPVERNKVIRPFLTTRKQVFVDWCNNRGIEWYEDGSNIDVRHMRNYVRHCLMPHALHVNPGLHKMVNKIVLKHVDNVVK